MTFRIHFRWPDGTYDYIDISGPDVGDIRDMAQPSTSNTDYMKESQTHHHGKDEYSEEQTL